MKKLIVIISTLILSIGLIACGNEASNIIYTKEFSYVPAYNSDMKADSTEPANIAGLSTANYTLKNTTKDKVFDTYENLLKQDGWTITKEQKPANIMATKDIHQVTVVIMQLKEDIKLIIMAK